MKTTLETDQLLKEAVNVLTEVDDVVRTITHPALQTQDVFFTKIAGAVALNMLRSKSMFAFGQYGLEIYNPNKASTIQ